MGRYHWFGHICLIISKQNLSFCPFMIHVIILTFIIPLLILLSQSLLHHHSSRRIHNSLWPEVLITTKLWIPHHPRTKSIVTSWNSSLQHPNSAKSSSCLPLLVPSHTSLHTTHSDLSVCSTVSRCRPTTKGIQASQPSLGWTDPISGPRWSIYQCRPYPGRFWSQFVLRMYPRTAPSPSALPSIKRIPPARPNGSNHSSTRYVTHFSHHIYFNSIVISPSHHCWFTQPPTRSHQSNLLPRIPLLESFSWFFYQLSSPSFTGVRPS